MVAMRARMHSVRDMLSRGVVFAALGLTLFTATAWSAERMEFVTPAATGRIAVPNETLIPNSTHAFAQPIQYSFQYSWARQAAWGDINGDGLNDIVAAATYFLWKPELPLQIWGNAGNGKFENRTSDFISGPVPTIGSANNIFVHDFNGDGRSDIYIVDQGLEDKDAYNPGMDGHTNHLLLSEADGKLHDRSSTLPGNVPAFNHFSSMADVNNDGNQDIVMTVLGGPAIGNGGVYFLLSDGRGGFTRTTQGIPRDFAFPWGNNNERDWHYPGTSTVCDVDGDGRGDLISGSYVSVDRLSKQRHVRFHQQQADGTFVEKRRDPIPAAIAALSDAAGTFTAIGVYQIVCGKLTGGKYNDVLVAWENRTTTYHVLLRNNGNFDFTDITLSTFGKYESSYQHSSGGSYPIAQITVIDVDGDGFDDLLYKTHGGTDADTLTQKTGFIHLNDGRGRFSPFRLAANGRQLSKAEAEVAMGSAFSNSVALVFDAGGSTQNDLVLLNSLGDQTSGPIMQSKSIGLITFINTAPSRTTLSPSVVFSTIQRTSTSLLRFFNTGASAGTAIATLRDSASGQVLGKWTTPSIPSGTQQQFYIGAIENETLPAGRIPENYSLSLQSNITGTFQHVLAHTTGVRSNISSCFQGATADPIRLSAVNTSTVGTAGFASTIVVSNTGSAAGAVSLGVYDARNGSKLGTFVTPSIPANAQAFLTVASIEAGAGVTPTAEMYHYIIRAEGTFTGFLQHLITNQDTGIITDMTRQCALDGSAAAAPTSPLRVSAVFSTTNTSAQSLLRFHNTGTSAGRATVTLRNSTTGLSLGQWASPSIPAGSQQQYYIGTLEAALAAGATKPAYYAISVESNFAGSFQHVLAHPEGVRSNLSTCSSGVTADPIRLSAVNTSTVGAAGFSSVVVVNNTSGSESAVSLGLYDARNGAKLGTYVTAPIPANAQASLAVASIEAGTGVTPTADMYHYIIKAEAPFGGFLQHLITNRRAGTTTDMTGVCTLPVS